MSRTGHQGALPLLCLCAGRQDKDRVSRLCLTDFGPLRPESHYRRQAGPTRDTGTMPGVHQALPSWSSRRLAWRSKVPGGIAVVGAAAGKQPHDPESGKQPTQLCDLLALTGIEVEAVKEGFSINARVSPHGYVLKEVGRLGGPVAEYGGLEV